MLLFKYKKVMQNNKSKISALTQDEEFELLHGSYSVSDIQDYFKYIFKRNMSQLLTILK